MHQVDMEDCSTSITKAVAGSWTVSQDTVEETLLCLNEKERTTSLARLSTEACELSRKGHSQLALKLSLYAQRFGWQGDIQEVKRASLVMQVEALRDYESLFRLATDCAALDSAYIKEVAVQCFEEGAAACQLSESQYWMQKAWDLLQTCCIEEKLIAAVGLALGEVLGLYSGKYAEAERILRRCYDIEAHINPLSEETMKVCNWIAGVCYHSGRWNYAEEMCLWILCTFSTTSHAGEHFWTTVQYLVFSYYYQNNAAEAHTFVEKWRDKAIGEDSELSEALKLTVLARHAQGQGNYAEAEKLLTRALALSEEHHPTSVLAALDHRLLGVLHYNLKHLSLAEEHYTKASVLYEAVAPQSIDAAKNLNSMGMLYDDLGQFSKAEEHYKKAQAIYDAVSPHSVCAASNLNDMGNLYHNSSQFSEAAEHYRRANAIYEAVSPRSVNAAINLYNMGVLHYHLRQFTEAEEHYRKASEVYEAAAPWSLDAAINFNNLGALYDDLKRFNEAAEHYRRARTIFEAVSPQSEHAANNLSCMGVLCYNMKQFSEAEEHYRKARKIYEVVSPHSMYAAKNINNMGLLYAAMGKINDAIMAFEAVRDIYIDTESQSYARDAESALTHLRKMTTSASSN